MVYLGVDLHRKVSHVVALDTDGDVILSRRFGNERAAFQRVFGELEPEPIEVAFEATYGWSWFADLLADAGIPAHMAHPLATKAISSGRVKNDAVDAKTLAHLLRTNLLPEAWIAPVEVREARRLVVGEHERCREIATKSAEAIEVSRAWQRPPWLIRAAAREPASDSSGP